MVDPSPDSRARAPLSASAVVDAACDRFEADWKAGNEPQIEDYLERSRPELESVLVEALLTVECELRLRADDPPYRQRYLERFPAFHEQVERVFSRCHQRSRPSAGPACVTDVDALSTGKFRRMEVSAGLFGVRCPSCHTPLVVDDPSGSLEVDCVACGTHFHVLNDASTAAHGPGPVKTLGNFELLEQIGVGRFAVVWKARDRTLQRIVAIKMPRRSQFERVAVEDFVREAQAAAQVKHPGIVGIYEVGCVDDTAYIACEFIEGVSLKDWLTGQRLTPTEAAQLCLKIAAALEAAHQAGVIHRDLKPGNILLDARGEPHIADFGLAKRACDEVTVTLEGQILGTPAYMSPEQACGEGCHADFRTDVYALGVILYELLTGELPFRGDAQMMLFQVKFEEPASPRKIASRIPRDLETICLKCMEKTPSRRYATAGALADDLGSFLAGQPVRAVPVGAIGRIWRWYSRNPNSTRYAAAGYSVGAAGLTVVWNLLGILTLLADYFPAREPGRLLLSLFLLMVCVVVPGLWVAIRTLNGWRTGLWLLAALWLFATVSVGVGYLGIAFDDVAYGDAVARRPLFSLLCVLCLIGLTLQIVAVTAHLLETFAAAGREQPGKPARRPQAASSPD